KAQIFKTAKNVTIFYNEPLPPPEGRDSVKYQPIPIINSKLDLSAIMTIIGNDGVHDLWVEAGGRLFQELILQKKVQRSFIYIAPKYLGEKAQSAFSNAENLFADMQQIEWQIKGKDALCEIEF